MKQSETRDGADRVVGGHRRPRRSVHRAAGRLDPPFALEVFHVEHAARAPAAPRGALAVRDHAGPRPAVALAPPLFHVEQSAPETCAILTTS